MPSDITNSFPSFSPNSKLSFVVADLYKTDMNITRYEAGEINRIHNILAGSNINRIVDRTEDCLLYTSDAADE